MTSNHLMHHFRAAMPRPEAVFMRSPEGREVTFGDLLARSAQYARVLTALGVAPGDRVAVQAEKSIESLIFYIAAIRAGAVYLPLNTAYTPTEIADLLADARPTLLVTDESRMDALKPVAAEAGVVHVRSLETGGADSLADAADGAPTTFDDVPTGPTDLAALLYTSGTTGRAKGAMLTHDNLLSNAQALLETWRFTRDDVLLHALPIFHTHGLFVATNLMLLAGGQMLVLPRFDVEAVLAALPDATSMMGVPTFYTRLVASGRLTPESCRHMRLFVSGSAPLLASTHAAFQAATGHAILERYGMTETNMITSNPYDGERRPGTVGFALPGVSIRVADPDTGAPAAEGEIGVVEVSGPNVFAGYWDLPEKTRQEFREDGYFVTGDLGQIDRDGYLAIVGRGKDLIISGGLNVYPKEVEDTIDAIAGVDESAVIGVPHPDFGEAVVAVVVPEAGADLAAQAIADALAGKLARFKQPKTVVLTDALPRNAMGKVQKAMLRDQHAGLFA